MFTVYILYAELFDSFYIGYTADIERRVAEHNNGKTSSTKAKRPWKLVFTESYEIQADAIRRERFLKKQKNKQFYKKISGLT